LLKPVQRDSLDRALNKVEAMLGKSRDVVDFQKLAEEVRALREQAKGYPDRIPSRLGDRVCFIDLARVTHFYADDKLTYAVADGKSYCIDHSITELEKRLNPKQFIRIHRATLLNAAWVKEIAPSFSGSLVVRLRDSKTTELVVARSRSHELKTRLGV
jgi:two-component system LytT family response regulator